MTVKLGTAAYRLYPVLAVSFTPPSFTMAA